MIEFQAQREAREEVARQVARARRARRQRPVSPGRNLLNALAGLLAARASDGSQAAS